MDIHFAYSKKRREFGRQCFFSDVGPNMLIDIPHDSKLAEEYIRLKSVDKGMQCVHPMSEHDVNTISAQKEPRGMNHNEGGWPADINPCDEDQVARFRKKVEKFESYAGIIINLGESMEHCVKQNTAIDIYEEYFPEEEIEKEEDIPSVRTVNVFRDFNPMSRSVSHISWCPESLNRLAVAYSSEFQCATESISLDSYVWDIENCNQPFLTLRPDSSLVCMEYCPKDVNTLIGGCDNGQLVLWDTRKGPIPVEITPVEHSHKDIVYDVKWLPSKSSTECFSGSADSQVLWWDIRKLSEPTDIFILDPSKTECPNLDQIYGAMCLEYEPTMPNKFLIGTEQGVVFSCNRKNKTPAEKIAALYKGHQSSVYTVQRNPFFLKNFLTVGAWVARIWSEDIKESSLLSMWNRDSYITGGCWSPTRPSVKFLTKSSGDLEIWDILFKQHAPTLCIKVEDEGLCCVKVNEQGNLVACGAESGTTYLLQPSPSLSLMQKNDKSFLGSLFEREAKREKILEARSKELLKSMEKPEEDIEIDDKVSSKEIVHDVDDVERDYLENVGEEKQHIDEAMENMMKEGEDVGDDEDTGEEEDLQIPDFSKEIEKVVRDVVEQVITEVEDRGKYSFGFDDYGPDVSTGEMQSEITIQFDHETPSITIEGEPDSEVVEQDVSPSEKTDDSS